MANGDTPGPVAAALGQGPPIGPGDPYYDRFLQEFKRKPNLDELEREVARRTLRAGYADVAPIQQPPVLRARATEMPSFAEQRVLMHLQDPELFGPGVSRTQQAKVAAGRFTKALLGTAKGLLVDLPRAGLEAAGAGFTGPELAQQERAQQVGAQGPENAVAPAAAILAGAANLPEQARSLAAADPFSALGAIAGMGIAGEAMKAPGELVKPGAEPIPGAVPTPKPPISELEVPTFRRRAGQIPKAAAPVLAGTNLEAPTYLRREAAGQGVTVEQLEANNAAQAAAIAAERQRIQAMVPRGAGVAAEAGPEVAPELAPAPPPGPPVEPAPALPQESILASERGAVPWDVEPGGRLYSRTQRAIEKAPFEKGTPEQWLALLEKAPGGTFREEVERSGLRQMLSGAAGPQLELLKSGARTLTKQDVLTAFQKNPLQIEEHHLTRGESSPHQQAQRAYENAREVTGQARADLTNHIGNAAGGLQSWKIREIADNLQNTASREEATKLLGQYGIVAERDRPGAVGPGTMETLLAASDRLRAADLAESAAQQRAETVRGGTPQYPQYTLGKFGLQPEANYREIVFAHKQAAVDLPPGFEVQPITTGEYPGFQVVGPKGEVISSAQARETAVHNAMATLRRSGEVPTPYTAGHWSGVQNPIAHTRLTDRTIGGKPTTFIEEIQSDVHQAGREEGYRDPAAEREARATSRVAKLDYDRAKEMAETRVRGNMSVDHTPYAGPSGLPHAAVYVGPVRIGALVQHPSKAWAFESNFRNFGTGATGLDLAFSQVIDEIASTNRVYQVLQEMHNQAGLNVPVPDAMKHAEFADRPESAVEWAYRELNDWNQAEKRFNEAEHGLEKVEKGVPKLPFSRTEDWAGLAVRRAIDEAVQNGHEKLGWTTGAQQADRYNLAKYVDELHYEPKYGNLTGYKRGQTMADETNITPEKLASYVGADVAKRLLEEPPTGVTETNPGVHILRGDQLHMGGQGMKFFYDQMLPKLVKEEFRKLGAKVEPQLEEMQGAGKIDVSNTDDVRTIARQQRGELRDFVGEVEENLSEGDIDESDLDQAITNIADSWRERAYDRLREDWNDQDHFDEDYAKEQAIEYVDDTYVGDLDAQIKRLYDNSDADLSHEQLRDWAADTLRDEQESFFDTVLRRLDRGARPGMTEPYTVTEVLNAIDDVRDGAINDEIQSQRDNYEPPEPDEDSLHEQADEDVGPLERRARELLLKEGPAAKPDKVWTVDIPKETAAKVKQEGQRLGAAPGGVLLPLAGAGVGAATGAAVAPQEHKRAGAALGALAGLGGGAFLSALLGRRAALPAPEAPIAPREPVAPPPGLPGGVSGEIRAAGPTNIVPPEFLERTRRKFPAAVADAVAARAAEVVQEKGLNAARPVSWAETQAAADKLAIDPSEISKQRALRLNAAELKAVVDVVNRNEQRIIDLQARLPNLPEDQLPEATRTLDALEKQNGDAVSVLLRASSQKGRDLNILKKLATDTQDPAVWLVKAQRMAGRPLTDEMKMEIRRILATGDRDHLARYVASLRHETLTGGILRGWVMGLVSVPGILWKAAVGGVAHTVIERLKDPVAGTLDLLASGVANRIGEAGTAIRTKPVGGLSLNAATARGWLQGLKNVVSAVRGQKVVDPLFPAGSRVGAEMAARAHIPQEYIDPTAYWKVARPAAWIVNAYNRHFSRWVGVAHSAYFVPLTEGGTARSMIEEAWAATKNEGVKEGTPAFKERFDWWVKNPTVEQQLRAIEYGSRMSLTHSTVLYEAARDVQRRLIQRGGVAGRVAGKVAAPIIKIPAAAASIATGYTPLGFLGGAADAATWARMIRQGVDASELAPIQKRMVERLARATTGSGVILAGYILAQHGLMTGAEPETPEQARVWKERGIGPYSLQTGKTQHWPVNMYPPAGFLLSFGASLYDIAHRMRTRTGAQPGLLERAAAAVAVPAKVALSTPFLEGPQQMTEAVTKPEQAGPRYLRQLAQSVVPASGLTRTVARALDPTERAPEGVAQDIQAVLPGLSKGVPPKITALGDEQQHVGGWLALLGSAAPRPDRAAADPLLKELASQGAAPGIPTRLPTETPEDYTRRAKLTGEFLRFRLNGLVHTDEYAAAKQVEQEGRQAVAQLIKADPRYAQATVEQLLGAYYDYAKQGDPQFKTPRELIDDETRKVHSEAAAAFFGKHRGRTKLAPVP